ncbi:hypothetical protein PG996_005261 [Apiospora saccharicola]|uniref:Uncharacterized protein n=1 Tax=Apiospora saccharicola TaxID=335842 RepID=A0ABR1VPZ9_9PEZI
MTRLVPLLPSQTPLRSKEPASQPAMLPIDSQSTSYGQNDNWLSSQFVDPQIQDYLDSQSPAPDSPGVIQTQTSDRSSRSATPSQPGTLTFAPSNNGTIDTASRQNGSSCIRYNVEWKVTFNRRSKAEDTEQDVALSPREFWEYSLRRKLENVVKKKLPANRSLQVEDARMIVSDRASAAIYGLCSLLVAYDKNAGSMLARVTYKRRQKRRREPWLRLLCLWALSLGIVL